MLGKFLNFLAGNAAKVGGVAEDASRGFTKDGREALASKGLLRDLMSGQKFGPSFKSASKAGWGQAFGMYGMMQLPMAMHAAGKAERGTKMSAFASGGVGFLGTGAATFAFGGGIGMVAGMMLDPIVQKTAGKAVQALHDLGMNATRLSTGGNYHDTQANLTMRQVACQQMAGSILNARQYLGKESLMLHDGA